MSVLSFNTVLVLLAYVSTWQGLAWSDSGDDYVKEACNVTQYQDLCIHSLAQFSNSARKDPCRWARAGVSVTTVEAKRVTQYLTNLKKSELLMGRKRVALSDCIECFQDTIDDLHKSLGELRSLNSTTFDMQMKNVETWMSAALTSEETCLDGFSIDRKQREVETICTRVLNATYMTSNALALVNKLASTGGGGINRSP